MYALFSLKPAWLTPVETNFNTPFYYFFHHEEIAAESITDIEN